MLDPELALTLFVAPVLLDAAFDASQRDLRQNWRAVAGLALGAVVLTVVAVAIVAHALVPGLPWAAAIALGAIVAPPDAAAATAVLKQLRPPNRLLVILEGESLFNDASALLIYRFAIAASVTGFASTWSFPVMLIAVGAGRFIAPGGEYIPGGLSNGDGPAQPLIAAASINEAFRAVDLPRISYLPRQ
jgi:CPA1 family monovalent cation:H+ antiporter